ncbi:MAG TPA: hypothetical protein VFO41_14635 [Alphaproteobacteria bacterium]|nr:hypothetical protein [Alphaproteobacteria bacterium]
MAALLGGPATGQELRVRAPDMGEAETVFRWETDRCGPHDIPDTAARAFRDADGRVHLIASHSVNRALVGPDLDSVSPNCSVLFQGGNRGDPSQYDDRSWLAAFHTEDGRTIHALVHTEFQGHRRKALCPSGRYLTCWSNSITYAVSTDGGYSFRRPAPPNHLVAGLPYRYPGETDHNIGLFAPTNIIEHDGFYYALIFAERFRKQAHGTCVIRTDRLDDPQSWRAWDGDGFTIRFADPYREAIADESRHTCAPVGRGKLTRPVNALIRHEPSGLFVAVMTGRRPLRPDAAPTSGIFTSTSADLIHWSEPNLVLAAPTLHDHDCGDGQFLHYPSLLDPDDRSRNFENTDGSAFLYLTRFEMDGCRVGWNRDLVRLPVEISVKPTDR